MIYLDLLWLGFLKLLLRDAENTSDWCTPRARRAAARINTRLKATGRRIKERWIGDAPAEHDAMGDH